jgi:adenine deaminase
MIITGKIIDISARRICNGKVIIEGNRIKAIEETKESKDVYIMPGLADAHVHIESSMVVPSHFAVAAVRHGTVAIVTDPHEIANVMGKEGVEFMTENAEKVPVKILFGAPSCVPATDFETSGARLNADDISELLKEGKAGFLAEMMNFPGVIYDDREIYKKISVAQRAGVPIDGHAPGLSGDELKKYINAGITTDHECSSLEEALEKISHGMKILIREGSAAKNLDALAPLMKYHPDRVMLCTDDLHPETLEKGHINKIVARLVNMGYDLFDVVSAATKNVFEHYKINAGILREGDPADFIVVDDPSRMNILQTWIDGRCVYDGENTLFTPGKVAKINHFNCNRLLPGEISVRNQGGNIRIMVAQNGELLTEEEVTDAGKGEYVMTYPEKDILKIVVKERYNDGAPAVGFIKGFGLKRGAMATSVAHDSHNIIAVGCSDRAITAAINMIVDAEGGMSVVSEEVEDILKLPVAGIMSDMPVTAMARKYEHLSEMAKGLGCRLDAPFMTLSFMALLVIPKLKLSDRGLFDGIAFKHVPLFV